MATSSVAMPPQPPVDDDVPGTATAAASPAMLDRARGLVAGIAAANAAATTVAAVAAAASNVGSLSVPSSPTSNYNHSHNHNSGNASRALAAAAAAAAPGGVTRMEGIEMGSTNIGASGSGNGGVGGGGASGGGAILRGKRQGSLPPPPPPSAPTAGASSSSASAFRRGVGHRLGEAAVLGSSPASPAALDPSHHHHHHHNHHSHQSHQSHQQPHQHHHHPPHLFRPPIAATTASSTSSSSPSRSQPHRLAQSGRISKIRHQRASSTNSSTSSAAAAAVAAVVASLSSVSTPRSGAATSSEAHAGDTRPSGRSSRSNSGNSINSTRPRGGSGNADGIGASSIASSACSSTTNSAVTSSTSSPPLPSSPVLKASSAGGHGKTVPMGGTTATTTSTKSKPSGAQSDNAPVFSFWGPDPVPLPSRFSRIKRNLIRGHEAALEACWARLITALRDEVEHIEGLGAHLIPSIEYSDVEDPAQTARFGRDLRRYGVGVVRKVVPKPDADSMVDRTVNYLTQVAERNTAARPHVVPQDPTCFDLFWTPAQVDARAHPSVLRAQRFMMSLWETTPDDRLATRLPITYVDRIRIHGDVVAAAAAAAAAAAKSPKAPSASSDDSKAAAASTAAALRSLQPPQASSSLDMNSRLNSNPEPQSADDWIEALQSSAGIIAQVDNGSLERWEPDGYQRGGTYDNVFHGHWEDYDPWECASRVSSTMDLYNGYGACTIFRMFQGVLALSTIEPGMIRLLPSPKLATAYYLLRPFFSPRAPAPSVRSGPEWEAYLHPSNWTLERSPDTIIHGAVPGHAQRITEHWHPHLYLRSSMITLPTLQPGDYIFWHPDLPYHISSNNSGLRTPSANRRPDDISMLVYIPAAPLTQTNALYLARQRKAFQRGLPGPDFDSSGRAVVVEDPDIRPGEKHIADVGGPSALQGMGLAPWEAAATRACTPPSKSATGKDEDTEMAGAGEAETKSLTSSASGSHAEAEVIRLSNIILFPDRSMLGYSV
ncbi:hypothetical protein S7711_09055 [Stachybotrys chartarum IBT 7711]|uniref:DUF1479 domain protein n=1 Tax=Stachybotrys chartarum (strain CBS 109288 / IBT 7711) TaxID=1280523 RepID=A0A084APN1_STACB|nr:hypothetical protein S7711_09055 [Stachybotrys chartarum IBT 7711]